MATRNQRRKASRARKEAKANQMLTRALRVLADEKAKRNLTQPRLPARSPKGMGNARIYSGIGLVPMKGYGTGAFKPDKVHQPDWVKGQGLLPGRGLKVEGGA